MPAVRVVEIVAVVVSVAMFVGTILAIPWLVSRMSEDHFVKPPPQHSLPVKIGRNIAGGFLIAAGVAMLVLPGQGILTILIGLSVLDVPMKYRVLRSLLRRRRVRAALQAIRRRAGKPPLLFPEPAESAPGSNPA